MKFLYKIWSGYDGFTPRRVPDRLESRRVLLLGWDRYIDSVEDGHEVWVYFHGPRVRTPGVYVKGFVHGIDAKSKRVLLRVREHSVDEPLTDPSTSRRVAGVVAARGLQVFVYPEAWDTPPECNVDVTAESCRNRVCGSCQIWKRLPLVLDTSHTAPLLVEIATARDHPVRRRETGKRVGESARPFVASSVERTSELFYRFKAGEANLAYPLALGIYQALRKRRLLRVDCIVPIPLSPDKAAQGEIHRTRLLAQELAPLLDVPVEELLSLVEPISKHRLRTWAGLTARQFETQYRTALTVDPRVSAYQTVLLVEDVVTEGSTLRCAVEKIRHVQPKAKVVAATAGQMILRHVVLDDSAVAAA